jgi:hypothetical protein
MGRLYSNENFPLPVVERLRALGHDVLTIQEAGKADQALPDEEVLAFASREQRALLTLNRLHFIRLHRQQPGHAGIVVARSTLISRPKPGAFTRPSPGQPRWQANS